MDSNTPPARVAGEPDAGPAGTACSRTPIGRRRLLIVVGGGTASMAGCLDAGPAEADDEETVYTVLYVDDGDSTEVEVGPDQDLLSAGLDADVDIPYRCEVGTCGDCTARYDGDATAVVTHEGNDYLEDEQIEDGWVLTCVAYARDDLELEVAHPDD